MTNEVINTYQQFLDDDGQPLANGTIEFYVNEDTTLASIWSNEALTTAQSNPYTLDANGCIAGDVKYPGRRTLLIKNADGAHIRTLDNVGSMGAIGESIIPFATVAAAQASKILESGMTICIAARGSALFDLSSSGTANGYDVIYLTTSGLYATVRTSQGYLNAAMTGATYDDSTNDAAAIQAAIDALGSAGGGTVYITGPSRLSVTKGTNDKWGLKIPYSNVTIKINGKGSLRRLSSNISTYALSFPLILIGKPDDNDLADQVTNVKIKGGRMIGENTRHSTSGSALMDGRQAIWIKNADDVLIDGVRFTSIDSSAIWVQRPGEYDYENSAYYNTTKCYDITVNKCRFIGTAHSTAGRALLHAVVATADEVTVTNNYSKWCDDFLVCGTTYDDYNDVETDTYTDANLATAVKRVGRGYTVDGNTIVNSSEHGLYIDGMGISATGNNFIVTDSTTCNDYQIVTRGRGVSITGGTMTGVHRGISINTGAMDVTCTGTVINAVGDHAGGIVNISCNGLTSFINARSSYFGSYKPMTNIRVDVTINMPSTSQTNGVGLRLYTDTSDANFPNGQMINVNLAGTTINFAKKAILNLAPMARNVQCDNMIFNGKTFTETNFGATGAHDGANNAAVLTDSSESWTTNAFVGWTLKNKTDGSQTTVTANTATTITGVLSGGSDNDWDVSDVWQLVPPLNSLCVLAVDDSLTDPLQNVSFSNNKVKGFQYILYDDGGAGGAGTIYPPYGIQGNEFRFVEFWDTAAFIQPSIESRMRNNTGLRFLDRTGWFSGYSLENSMSDGSSNSEKKGCMLLVSSTDVRLYYDDSGNYKAL